MGMEQTMAHLVAEIGTSQEHLKQEMVVKMEASQEKMDANQTKTDANLKEMKEDMKSGKAEIKSTVSAFPEKTEAIIQSMKA
jgi:hypothetical protein